jgi:cellulose synthase/poly-beta-1,6-N-acetylglucosamine synthase-like glycosyltransferase
MVRVLYTFEISHLILTAVILSCLAILWHGLRRPRQQKSGYSPRVSVLVAARDEENHLPRLLQSLANQNYSDDLCEFIIIDDHSTDTTASVVQEWVEKDSRFYLVRLKDDPSLMMGPKKRALLAGMEISSGEIIFTTDADCLVPPEWISGLLSHFSDRTAAVCGMIRFEKVNTIWERLTAFETSINTILNAAVIGSGSALSCFGANFAFRRSDFRAVGGYDHGGRSISGDDDLLLQRFHRARKPLVFCSNPNLVVSTTAPDTFDSFFRRKQRHLSAGKYYSLPWIVLAIFLYVCCLWNLFMTLLAISGFAKGWITFTGWGTLSFGLLLVYWRGISTLKLNSYWRWAIPAALLFPVYIALVYPLSLLPSPTWKGRNAKITVNWR